MNAMVSTVMKRRRMGRLRAIQTLARRKWKEVTRKRRRGEKEEEEAESAPTPASRPRTSDQAAVSTNAEEEDEDEEGGDDDDVPPEVLRLIGQVLVRSRTLDNQVDDDYD